MRAAIVLLVLLQAVTSLAAGNTALESYGKVRRLLYDRIYHGHRQTVYCGAAFDENRHVTLPSDFSVPADAKRAYRTEVEHIVAAENFGRTFTEWRRGAPQCVDSRGHRFKGRKCAETNREFRRMEADLHNLAPAIGEVNARRRNYRFAMLPDVAPTFGSCLMKIRGRVVEPPDTAKGLVARTHLYMADAYPSRFRLNRAQRRLFEAWDRQFPPDAWEWERERRIGRLQRNHNPFTTRNAK